MTLSFEPFWRTIREKKVSTYVLREKHNVSSETINRLKHDKAITTTKLDDLCKILNCEVQDIIRYKKEDSDGIKFKV